MTGEQLEVLLVAVNEQMDFKHKPGWAGNKFRIFRKAVEELGEYAEALEYADGSRGKEKKYAPVTAKEKCVEEVVDLVMMALALAKCEGLLIEDVLLAVQSKVDKKIARIKKNENGSA